MASFLKNFFSKLKANFQAFPQYAKQAFQTNFPAIAPPKQKTAAEQLLQYQIAQQKGASGQNPYLISVKAPGPQTLIPVKPKGLSPSLAASFSKPGGGIQIQGSAPGTSLQGGFKTGALQFGQSPGGQFTFSAPQINPITGEVVGQRELPGIPIEFGGPSNQGIPLGAQFSSGSIASFLQGGGANAGAQFFQPTQNVSFFQPTAQGIAFQRTLPASEFLAAGLGSPSSRFSEATSFGGIPVRPALFSNVSTGGVSSVGARGATGASLAGGGIRNAIPQSRGFGGTGGGGGGPLAFTSGAFGIGGGGSGAGSRIGAGSIPFGYSPEDFDEENRRRAEQGLPPLQATIPGSSLQGGAFGRQLQGSAPNLQGTVPGSQLQGRGGNVIAQLQQGRPNVVAQLRQQPPRGVPFVPQQRIPGENFTFPLSTTLDTAQAAKTAVSQVSTSAQQSFEDMQNQIASLSQQLQAALEAQNPTPEEGLVLEEPIELEELPPEQRLSVKQQWEDFQKEMGLDIDLANYKKATDQIVAENEAFDAIIKDVRTNPDFPKSLAFRRIKEVQDLKEIRMNSLKFQIQALEGQIQFKRQQLNDFFGFAQRIESREERQRDNYRQQINQFISSGALADFGDKDLSALAAGGGYTLSAMKKLRAAVISARNKKNIELRGSPSEGFYQINVDTGEVKQILGAQPSKTDINADNYDNALLEAAQLFNASLQQTGTLDPELYGEVRSRIPAKFRNDFDSWASNNGFASPAIKQQFGIPFAKAPATILGQVNQLKAKKAPIETIQQFIIAKGFDPQSLQFGLQAYGGQPKKPGFLSGLGSKFKEGVKGIGSFFSGKGFFGK